MESDRFLQSLDVSERKTAQEFLTKCLPSLTKGLCNGCSRVLRDRIRSINTEHGSYRHDPQAEELDGCGEESVVNGEDEASSVARPIENDMGTAINGNGEASPVARCVENARGSAAKNGEDKASYVASPFENPMGTVINRYEEASPVVSCVENARGSAAIGEDEASSSASFGEIARGSFVNWEGEVSSKPMSWADMTEQEELEQESKNGLGDLMVEENGEVKLKKTELSRELREEIRFTNVGRKKDFVCLERIDGRLVNILNGLELHTGVFSSAEQKKIVNFVYDLQEKGRNNEFRDIHIPNQKVDAWQRKGDNPIRAKNGIPPGIVRNAVADPIPNLFKTMIRRLIGWHVLPTYCVPDSCIVNIYEPGDCIPPHIDSHDFVRPFCTVSFLSECKILLGSNLQIAAPGEFIGSASIPLPVGSVLVLNGNGADVAKHCVPAVPYKRISITFRKMVRAKWPYKFKLEPDLQNIKPYALRMESKQEEKEKDEELRESPSRNYPMNDYGSNRLYRERRVQMRQRNANGYADIDGDSFGRRQRRWDSRHPREGFRAFEENSGQRGR